ncbi:MAG: saccharopine dehydrogenase C-terminal domain-containing protein, partial [Saprospiraceae bacterium]
IEAGKKVKYIYTLYDQYDKKNKMSSMARTTGMTACAAAELILSGDFKTYGVHPPERLGVSAHWVLHIFQYLKNHGITYKLRRTER